MQHRLKLKEVPVGMSLPTHVHHKGLDCLLFTVGRYKELPWFLNCSQALRFIDFKSNGKSLAVYFPLPQALITTDGEKLFKSIVTCILCLHDQQWALESVREDTFCSNEEGEQICKLSPCCQVIADPDGTLIVKNLRDIRKLRLFGRRRMIHVLTSWTFSGIQSHGVLLITFPL
jgi:hypothetical protein